MTMDPVPQHSIRFRPSAALQVVEQRANGGPYFVVKHGPSGRCYGLTGTSYRMLRAFDGGRTLDEVAHEMPRAGGETAADQLRRFVERVVRSGLLEPDGFVPGPPPEIAAPTARDRLVARLKRFNPFYIRLGMIDPTRLLRRVQPILSPLFTLPALFVFLAALGGAAWLIADHSQRFWFSFYMFRDFGWWGLAYVILCAATFLHEIAHAVACRRYGGEVREMGILIYFFQLGAYTNVSDAWLMPARRHRIIVSLAGVYIEGFLFAIAIAVWAYTPWFSAANKISFVLAVIFAMRVVLNLFPLLKLDGYFVLSDLVGVKNLRPKSFAYVLSWLPRVGRLYASRHPVRRPVLLAIYGLLSVATIVWLVPYALWGLHDQLVDVASTAGRVTFWIALVILAPISIALFVRQIAVLRAEAR
jgi:putative peptide zinc metalloprotease protein